MTYFPLNCRPTLELTPRPPLDLLHSGGEGDLTLLEPW